MTGRARRVSAGGPALVAAVLIATLGVLAQVVGIAGAVSAWAAATTYAYDTAAYTYDAPALLSSPDTAKLSVRGSPTAPEVGSWVSPVSVRDRGVAANTEARVFSNLAPGDVVRPQGFTAINPSSLGSASGRYNYVVGTDGRLVLGNRRYGHIDLANGGDVLAAGEVRVVNGQVVSINNASGHYQPFGPGAQSAAEQAFGSSGLVVRPGAYVEVHR